MVVIFASWCAGVRVLLAGESRIMSAIRRGVFSSWAVVRRQAGRRGVSWRSARRCSRVCAECRCVDLHSDDEARAAIYDNVLLRKWVLWASPAQASFVETAGKSELGRRGEGDLARVACGMK